VCANPGRDHDNVTESFAIVIELDFCRQWMREVIAGPISGSVAKLPDIVSAPFPDRPSESSADECQSPPETATNVTQAGNLY